MNRNPVSGKALAAGKNQPSETPAASALPLTTHSDAIKLFITWTTYGTWLPGDNRGWRKWKAGQQQPQPLLEEWCRDQMKEQPLILNQCQREAVEDVIGEHAEIRGWDLAAVSVRSNHIHVAVVAAAPPKQVRDQFKANATRILRNMVSPVTHEKMWTKGGDIQFIDTDEDWEQVILYIVVAQDRMERGK